MLITLVTKLPRNDEYSYLSLTIVEKMLQYRSTILSGKLQLNMFMNQFFSEPESERKTE